MWETVISVALAVVLMVIAGFVVRVPPGRR